MDRVRFRLGEKKYVMIEVRSCNNQPFEVAKATYKLCCGLTEEAAGDCEINQVNDKTVILMALIQPQAKGATYELEFTYQIPPETLIYSVMVKVE